MVVVFLIVLVTLYCLGVLWLRRGLSISAAPAPSPAFEPAVSVIIAARNEEDRILPCLASLRELDYPAGKMEILIVDDCSTDKTAELVERFIGTGTDIQLLKSPPESGNLRGKTNAIAHGIRHSTGEIIMFTDADCSVSPGWIRATVRHFSEDTGVVGGFTILEIQNFFHGIQALDWLSLFGAASAASGLGIPLTAIGNNLAIRRTAYLQTGGYERIPFSVTEDYSLVQTILQRTAYTLRFPLEPEAVVTSRACDTVKQLFRQKQRWGVGGLDMVAPGMAIIALGWIMRAALAAGLFLTPAMVFLPVLAAALLADYFFLSKIFNLLPFDHVRKYFPGFEAYLTIYGLIIPFLALGSRHVVWKERTLRKRKKNALQVEGQY